MKILVIDDDVDFADGMAEMLTLFGHDADTAHSCNDAVAAARAKPFELALIDVGLAGRNGAECARDLQKMSNEISCVLMTGYSADVLARMGILPNEFGILRKPVKPEDLAPYLKD